MDVEVRLAWAGGLPEERVNRLLGCLPAHEQERANRFGVPVPRAEYVVGRIMLRRLVAARTGLIPHQVQWSTTPQGKPMLPVEWGWQFNVSHSHGWVALAAARSQELGLDIECHRPLPDREALSARCFGPSEQPFLNGTVEAFYGLWTMKEALLKASGDGIGRWPLKSIAVSTDPPAVLAYPGEANPQLRWQAARFEHTLPGVRLSGAVCAASASPLVLALNLVTGLEL